MLDFSVDFVRDRTEVTEIQEEQLLINRFLLPAYAKDNLRRDMFNHLMDVIDEVCTTTNRIMIESGQDFFTVRRLPGGGYNTEVHENDVSEETISELEDELRKEIYGEGKPSQ